MALCDAFIKGLSEAMQDLLVHLNLPEDPDSMIGQATSYSSPGSHQMMLLPGDVTAAVTQTGTQAFVSLLCLKIHLEQLPFSRKP